MIKKILLICSLLILSALPVAAATYYVRTDGHDTSCDGLTNQSLAGESGDGNDCAFLTINHALDTVSSNDEIQVAAGTYTEGQLTITSEASAKTSITLTAVNQTGPDSPDVIIQPNANLSESTAHLVITDDNPGTDGVAIEISHIEFDGTTASYTAHRFLDLQNVSNVRIHHCKIHDYTQGTSVDSDQNNRGLSVKSTQIAASSTVDDYWPTDPGTLGDDTNIDNEGPWPSNPVIGFELDHNDIDDVDPLYLYHAKNSSIHHNNWDNTGSHVWCIKATNAMWENVDIYHNTFAGDDSWSPDASQNIWRVEAWIHRNGCEFYENYTEGLLSLSSGKETTISKNFVILDTLQTSYEDGLEFALQSYATVEDNYIYGSGVGTSLGKSNTYASWITKETTVQRNVFDHYEQDGIRIIAYESAYTTPTPQTINFTVTDNLLIGTRGTDGIEFRQSDDAVVSGHTVTNNVILSHSGYGGKTTGTASVDSISGNYYCGNTNDYFEGVGEASGDRTVCTGSDAKPELRYAEIASDGNSITLYFTESVYNADTASTPTLSDVSNGVDISAYSSGNETTSIVYTLSGATPSGKATDDGDRTIYLAYTQPGDGSGLEDNNGNDLDSITTRLVKNGSTVAGAADSESPTLTVEGCTVSPDGFEITVDFTETIVSTGYTAGDFDMDCTSETNISLSSPTGTGARRTFTAEEAIFDGETCNLDFNGAANSIEDGDGNDMAADTNFAVTNDSAVLKPIANAGSGVGGGSGYGKGGGSGWIKGK